MYDYRIINGLVYQNQSFEQTNIYIKDGLIATISSNLFDAKNTYDCKGDMVLPGILDPHTHFALDLGHISSVDDFSNGTKAAAFGGVTTVIDFLEPVQTADEMIHAFEQRKQQAKDSVINVKFHACVRDPKHIKDIVDTMEKLGLNTVKLFTTYSDSNRRTFDPQIKELLTYSRSNQFLVTAHIECDELIVHDEQASYQRLPDHRPTISETTEALKLAEFVRETKGKLYMVHCSSGDTLQTLKEQYSDILNKSFYIESCPHYLLFDRDKLLQDDGYLYTMAPPLRAKQEQQRLMERIDDIYTIGTDHCTFLQQDKQQDKLIDMPLGVGGVEESFRVLYTKFGDSIIDKMTINVAKAHHLYPQKGVIQEGSDADLFIYRKTPSLITLGHGLCDYTIYQDMPVNGEVISTMIQGTFVIKHQQFQTASGQILHK